jgi:NmrA-like family
LVLDVTEHVDEVAEQLKPFNTIISAIGFNGQRDDLVLIEAAAKAGTKRFVPCGFITVCPPGVMKLRNEKEEVHAAIWRLHIPYTIIDVGYWYQLSFPKLPSGKFDYAMVFPEAKMYGDGEAPTIMTDKRDMGRFVGRIIKDPRTLNKRVFTHGDVLSQKEIWKIVEDKSGEKIDTTFVSKTLLQKHLLTMYKISAEECVAEKEKAETDDGPKGPILRSRWQYITSKFIRKDNTPEVAKYLGYLDARELYPDFKPNSFSEYIDELLAGKGARPYAGRY